VCQRWAHWAEVRTRLVVPILRELHPELDGSLLREPGACHATAAQSVGAVPLVAHALGVASEESGAARDIDVEAHPRDAFILGRMAWKTAGVLDQHAEWIPVAPGKARESPKNERGCLEGTSVWRPSCTSSFGRREVTRGVLGRSGRLCEAVIRGATAHSLMIGMGSVTHAEDDGCLDESRCSTWN